MLRTVLEDRGKAMPPVKDTSYSEVYGFKGGLLAPRHHTASLTMQCLKTPSLEKMTFDNWTTSITPDSVAPKTAY